MCSSSSLRQGHRRSSRHCLLCNGGGFVRRWFWNVLDSLRTWSQKRAIIIVIIIYHHHVLLLHHFDFDDDHCQDCQHFPRHFSHFLATLPIISINNVMIHGSSSPSDNPRNLHHQPLRERCSSTRHTRTFPCLMVVAA